MSDDIGALDTRTVFDLIEYLKAEAMKDPAFLNRPVVLDDPDTGWLLPLRWGDRLPEDAASTDSPNRFTVSAAYTDANL